MARTWLEIRVVLEGGGGIDCEPPPGRTMIVGPGHTFEQLATAINAAFARWDLSHLHDFRLADGRRVGFPNEDFDEPQWPDHATLKVMDELKPGDEFEYVFVRRPLAAPMCCVGGQGRPGAGLRDLVRAIGGDLGWGWIPDQYGRISEAGEEPEAEPA